jgi:hypothetical protein
MQQAADLNAKPNRFSDEPACTRLIMPANS